MVTYLTFRVLSNVLIYLYWFIVITLHLTLTHIGSQVFSLSLVVWLVMFGSVNGKNELIVYCKLTLISITST